MTKQLSLHEFEILSAYLDGELTSQEQLHLEQSLGQRSDLQQALEELRRTRIILRSAAHLRAPRNFTLTSEMVGRVKPARKPFFVFTALRFSSALATFLLVLSLFGEWIAFSGPAAAPVALMSAPATEEINAAVEAMPAEPEAALLPAPTNEVPEGARQAYSAAPSAKDFGTPLETPLPTGEVISAQPEIDMTPGAGAGSAEPMVGSAMVAETPTPEVMLAQPAPAASEAPAIEAFSMPETPTPEIEQPLEQAIPAQESAQDTGEAVAMQPAEAETTVDPHLPWRFTQVILLLLAVISAAGAIILRQLDR